jgi:hypothetical protein
LNGSLLHPRTLRPSSSMFFRSMLDCRGTYNIQMQKTGAVARF